MSVMTLNPEAKAPRRYALWGSVGVHLALLLWVIHARTPIFVAPSSGLAGVHGEVVTQLYWSAASGAGETSPDSASAKDSVASRSRLIAPAKRSRQLPLPQTVASNAQGAESLANEATQAGASAGNPYGSLSSGNESGHEIRAALPVTTFEPIVDRSQLPGGVEGNCVVEITIDENGAVVDKAVVQSLGPAIDSQVLAAVERWHFRPATRDGVPIPSKQDVVYHIKPA
jgi:TonB family protein